MKKRFLIALFLTSCFGLFAQSEKDTVVAEVAFVNPTVMVIPFVKEGQDLRTIYESNESVALRVAMTEVKEGLEKQELQTIDFRAILKQASSQVAMTANQQTSLKQRVISLSAADIYIETETQFIETPRGNSVSVILTAYDAFTGISFVNKIGSSPKFYTEDYAKLTQKALDTFLDDFVVTLQKTFQDKLENGRTIAVDIGFAQNATIDMDTEVGESGELLSDVIESWFEANAFKSYFHIQGVTATKMILDEVKIPAIDEATKKNYPPTKFAKRLRKYFSSLGFEVTRDVQGTKIFITLSDG